MSHKVFLRRDYQHRGCKNGEAGGEKLKPVDRQTHSFGEEETKYKQFKKEMRQMIREIKERKPTPTDGNHDFHRFNKSKPEYNKRRNEYVNGNYTIPKKARQEVANKENIFLPIGNIISPVRSLSSTEKQERRIMLAPKELIVPPNPALYPLY
ncbi:unnamed protein product [Mytilus coruscus]|uniref:Uncharacterized protein n=1 Tax=Mytilus coruscus TaxID=42192 RepID=A0A6J8D632_MYTCO|nr:unnamed protein product [Mytilus coruscus]